MAADGEVSIILRHDEQGNYYLFISNLIAVSYTHRKPIVLKKNLDIATVSRIEAHRSELPGVSIESSPERTYLEGTLASHVLGYIGEISQKELEAQTAAAEAVSYTHLVK